MLTGRFQLMNRKEYLDSLKPYGEKCHDCGGKNHPYMLKNKLWKQYVPDGRNRNSKIECVNKQIVHVGSGFFICLSCIEVRMGRRLTMDDFSDFPINLGCFGFDYRVYCRLEE